MEGFYNLGGDVRNVQGIRQVPLILDVCRRISGMRFVAVARVTDDHWVTCAAKDDLEFGLRPGDELDVRSTLCHEVRQSRNIVTIDDAHRDAAYCGHHTPAKYGFRSYISVPIVRTDGSFFGTLCALDPEPANPCKPEIVDTFVLFAELISAQLDMTEELHASRADLEDAHGTAKQREEFIAIVGHDLRNPLAAIGAGLRMMRRARDAEMTEMLYKEMDGSVARMNSIIGNLMDFARGRLGTGINADIERGVDLERIIETVSSELEVVNQREVRRTYDLPGAVPCDGQRIGQLVSNLLSNAFAHGAENEPVLLAARHEGGYLQIDVSNTGAPIPPAVMENLFKPFFRQTGVPRKSGVGLGLYISSEIAIAHGGTLTVSSDDAATTFTFRMPC